MFPVHNCMPLPKIKIIQRNNLNWALMDSDDFISNTIERSGAWAAEEVALCHQLIAHVETPLILDIGANLGAFSVPLAKMIEGRGGVVWAFEPQRVIHQQLCTNLFINRIENVKTFAVALGSKSDEVEIPALNYHETKNVGAFSLEEKVLSVVNIVQHKDGRSEKISINRLDDLTTNAVVSLIKIDVEGREAEVLRGASSTLHKSSYPPVVYEEWRENKYQGEVEAISASNRVQTREILEDLGYQLIKMGNTVLAVHPEGHVSVSRVETADGLSLEIKPKKRIEE